MVFCIRNVLTLFRWKWLMIIYVWSFNSSFCPDKKKRISRTVNNGSAWGCPMSMLVLSYMLTNSVDIKIFLPVSKRVTFCILNLLYTYDTFSGDNLFISTFSLEVLTIFISFRSHWTSMVLLGCPLVTYAVKSIVFPWCVIMLVVVRFTEKSTEPNTKANKKQ